MKVLIASGGTGGHIFPALALANSLKKLKANTEVSFAVSTKTVGRTILDSAGINGYEISANLTKAILESAALLRRLRPDIVAGFGGYGSFAVVLCARLLGIPALIHEQNVLFGKANRVLSLFASRVAVSFPCADNNYSGGKFVVTGNPIREELLGLPAGDAFQFFNFEKGRFTLLIMGGSQGAQAINAASAGLALLFGQDEKKNLQIIHLSGSAERARLEWIYKNETIEARVFDFLKDMRYAYSVADLVIARAGATTVAELTALGRPSILIPYPYAAGHQAANAKVLEKAGGCYVIHQDELKPRGLYMLIKKLMDKRDILELMGRNARRIGAPGASENLAKEVMRLAKR